MSTLVDFTLLKTKMSVPVARDGTIERARLRRAIEAAPNAKLTAICAPAGYGKTTLLGEWARGRGEAAAWLSLDGNDNDPAKFWRYVSHALAEALPPDSLSRSIPLAKALPNVSMPTFLDSLVNELYAHGEPIALILDDYHAIADERIHESMAYFLDYSPPNVQTAIASRAELPFKAGKRKANEERIDIGAGELRFNRDETENFCAKASDIPLSERQMGKLLQRTEGWIAGLQLAMISLRSQENRDRFIEQFQGNNRSVSDFLFEEAFGKLPDELQEFLMLTSVADRMDAGIADALTGQTNGRAMLDKLRTLNLFLVPIDEQDEWFRYHQLFSTFLRGILKRSDPAAWLTANRRASESYAGRGLLGEAIDHAIEAREYKLAEELLTGHAATAFRQGEIPTLLRWYGSLPAEGGRNADMTLLYAFLLAIAGMTDQAEEELDRARRQLALLDDEAARAKLRSAALFVESNVIFFGGRFERWHTFAEGAAADMLPDDRIFYYVNFNLTEPLVRRTTLGLKGMLNPGTEAIGQAFLKVLETHGWHDSFIGLYVIQSLAEGYYEWNRLEESRELAGRVEAISGRIGLPGLQVPLAILRSRQLLSEGKTAMAHAALDHAAEVAETYPEAHWGSYLRAGKAAAYLAEDKVAEAKKALAPLRLSEKDKPSFNREYEYLAYVRLLIRQRKFTPALRLLEGLKPQAAREALMSSQAEIALLQAIAEQGRGQRQHALRYLREALAIGSANGYVRTFLDEGREAAELLRQLAQEEPYARALLDAFPAKTTGQNPSGEDLAEPLQENELALLRLLRAGASNQDIAKETALSVGTVKVYLSRAYAKLGVSSRTQAINKAEQLGLLE